MSALPERDVGIIRKLFEGFSEGLHFEFLKDMVQKSTIFFVLVILSYLINFIINALDAAQGSALFHASANVVYGLNGLEQLLFWSDVFWFSTYLVISTYRLTKAIILSARTTATVDTESARERPLASH